MSYNSINLVPVYRLAAPSQCDLCTPNDGLVDMCAPLLTAISNVVYLNPINYDDFGITNETVIDQIRQLELQAGIVCGVTENSQASVQILQYQTQVLCASSQNFSMAVSTAGNIDNIVDLRSLVQCGQCAVVPCQLGETN